jgi:hypothetical protein
MKTFTESANGRRFTAMLQSQMSRMGWYPEGRTAKTQPYSAWETLQRCSSDYLPVEME